MTMPILIFKGCPGYHIFRWYLKYPFWGVPAWRFHHKQGRQSDRGRLLWCHTQQSPNPGEMIYKACFIVRIMPVILPRLPFSVRDNGKSGIYITNYAIWWHFCAVQLQKYIHLKKRFLSKNPFFFGNECQFHVQLGSKTLGRVFASFTLFSM
jgi:hypothetical protein